MNRVYIIDFKKTKTWFLVLFLFFNVLCTYSLAQAQMPHLGVPIISNFDSKIYKAHDQNWVAVQDARGVVFIGNSSGIVEYDGQRWNLISVKGSNSVRGLTIADDGTIFYGSIGEFGYLSSSASGKIITVSLNDLIPAEANKFNDVWQIESTKQGVYFFTRSAIYRFYKGKITVLPGKLANTQVTVLNDTIFYADIDHGMSLIDGDHIEVISQLANVYNGKRIALTPFAQHEILVARSSGDFLRLDLTSLWDENTKKYTVKKSKINTKLDTEKHVEEKDLVFPFATNFDALIQTEQAHAYKLMAIDANTFAMATLRAGIFVFDRSGKVVRVINKNNGLIDNVSLGFMLDRSKNMWVTSNLGLSYVELSVPQTKYGERNGIDGMALSTHYYGGDLYVGTFQGASVQTPFNYSIKNSVPQFVPIKNSTSSIWDFKEVEGDLMVATAEGLYQFKNYEAFKIAGTERVAYTLGTSPKWPKYLFVGLLGGIQIFKRIDDHWTYVGKIKEITSNVKNIEVDQSGDLWLASDARGLIRVHFNGVSPTDVSIHYLGKKHGLDEIQIFRVLFEKSTMHLLTTKGLLQASIKPWQEGVGEDGDDTVFTPDVLLGKSFQNPIKSVEDMISDERGGFVFASEGNIFSFHLDKNGVVQTGTYAFRGLNAPSGEFFKAADGAILLPGKGLVRVDVGTNKNYQQSFDVLIRRVIMQNKDVLFEGNYGEVGQTILSNPTIFVTQQNNNNIPKLTYAQNALVFEFSASFFEKPGTTQFQYKLEGFDEQWGTWDYASSKEYTNIPEGKYTFKVRAKNLYDTVGQDASYSFVILPPWYRTMWAYLLWLLLVVLALAGMIRVYSIRFKREKALLEAMVSERTQQLRDATLTDPLTGLRNRRFISEVLHSDITAFVGYKNYLIESEGHRDGMSGKEIFGLFLLDMDHFKQVNDTYGHDAGDQLLKQFAQTLLECVREDDVVIRLGGEEFLVVLKKTNPQYIHEFANKLLSTVEQAKFDLGNGIIVHKTCSIGYAAFPLYSENPNLMSFDQGVMIADMAMYLAKHQGRNQAVFLHQGINMPTNEEDMQKTATSLEFALKGNYLAQGKPPNIDE